MISSQPGARIWDSTGTSTGTSTFALGLGFHAITALCKCSVWCEACSWTSYMRFIYTLVHCASTSTVMSVSTTYTSSRFTVANTIVTITLGYDLHLFPTLSFQHDHQF